MFKKLSFVFVFFIVFLLMGGLFAQDVPVENGSFEPEQSDDLFEDDDPPSWINNGSNSPNKPNEPKQEPESDKPVPDIPDDDYDPGSLADIVKRSLLILITAGGCPDGGWLGFNGLTCCKDGFALNKDGVYDVIHNACGCPRDGKAGKMGACCRNGYMYNWQHKQYDSVYAECGCPDGGKPGKDNVTCCKDGYGYVQAYEDEYSQKMFKGKKMGGYVGTSAVCGCPEGSFPSEKDPYTCCCSDGTGYITTTDLDAFGAKTVVTWKGCGALSPHCGKGCPDGGKAGNDNSTCCKDGLKLIKFGNNSFEYNVIDIEKCGCPNGGTLIGGVCCQNGLALKNTYYYEGYGEPSKVCGCPDGGEWKEATGICCKGHKGYDPKTKKYVKNVIKCGCPLGGDLIENEYCCKDGLGLQYNNGNEDEPVYRYKTPVCPCPDGEEKTNDHCCPIGSVWFDEP